MEKKLLAISLTFLVALLGMFSSVGLVLANITAPPQAASTGLIVVLGLLVCFMVIAGWLALRWFHQYKRKGQLNVRKVRVGIHKRVSWLILRKNRVLP